MIVFNERHLVRMLTSYFAYSHHRRTHRALAMDTPERHSVQLPMLGGVVAVPEVDGLHHHYEQWIA
jgi:hypothetical protein